MENAIVMTNKADESEKYMFCPNCYEYMEYDRNTEIFTCCNCDTVTEQPLEDSTELL